MTMHCVFQNVFDIVLYTFVSTFVIYTFSFCNCLLRTGFYESCFVLLYVSTRRVPPQRPAGKILVYIKVILSIIIRESKIKKTI
ncbi:hypothetical protein Hanom_Chr09g00850761 [Helianthus anomalus]